MFSLWLCFGRAFNHFTHAYFVRGQVCFNIINHFTTDITYLICTPLYRSPGVPGLPARRFVVLLTSLCVCVTR